MAFSQSSSRLPLESWMAGRKQRSFHHLEGLREQKKTPNLLPAYAGWDPFPAAKSKCGCNLYNCWWVLSVKTSLSRGLHCLDYVTDGVMLSKVGNKGVRINVEIRRMLLRLSLVTCLQFLLRLLEYFRKIPPKLWLHLRTWGRLAGCCHWLGEPRAAPAPSSLPSSPCVHVQMAANCIWWLSLPLTNAGTSFQYLSVLGVRRNSQMSLFRAFCHWM